MAQRQNGEKGVKRHDSLDGVRGGRDTEEGGQRTGCGGIMMRVE